MLPEADLSPAQCFDALESNLKTVLLHTGSAIGHAANFDATNITLTKDRVRKSLPPALGNFQRALGDLELELIRARSVLHRNLTASRLSSSRKAASSAAAESANASRTSPDSQEAEPDTVMVEAPHSAVLSHVFGPSTPPKLDQQAQEPNGSVVDADDPLAHPKPSVQSTQTASNKDPLNSAGNLDYEAAKADDGSMVGVGEASKVTNVPINNDRAAAAVTSRPDNSQQINETPQTNDKALQLQETQTLGFPSTSLDQNGNTSLSGIELFAHGDRNANGDCAGNGDNFNVADFNSPNAFGAVNASGDADNGEQNQSQEFNSAMPVDFLQDGTGNGTSFEEQFDFSTFDFGGSGEGDTADTNGDAQTWDSNFFDESLFNLDGGTDD